MTTPPSHLSTDNAAADAKRWERVQVFKAQTLENDPKVGIPKRTDQQIRDLEQTSWDRELMLESSVHQRKEKEAAEAQAAQSESTDSNAPTHTGDGSALQPRDHMANPVNPMKRTMG